MKFYIEPEISWTQWLKHACDTAVGEFLEGKLSGGTFIDIPCGSENSCRDVQKIIRRFGVRTYIEVDNSAEILGERLKDPNRTVGEISVQTHQADVLEFLSGLDTCTEPRTIYIAGLQPDEEFCKDPSNQADIVVPYLQSMYTELDRVCKTGDLVILNEASTLVSGLDEKIYGHIHPSIALLKHSFKLQRTCPYGKVSVFEKMK